jgi:HTH-type transcriptional regulator/antitoxin HigA
MIKNKRQYQVSLKALEDLKKGFKLHVLNEEQAPYSSKIKKAQQSAIKGSIEELEFQMKEYDQLIRKEIQEIEITNINHIPELLIKTRLFRGLSHKELGEKMGIAEQQIQRYEATDYESASFNRILEVAYALGIRDKISFKVDLRGDEKKQVPA